MHSFAIVFIALVGLAVTGCQSSSEGSKSRPYIKLSDPKTLPLADADINLADFLKPEQMTLTRTFTNNGTTVFDQYFMGKTVIATTQRATDAWYSQETLDALNDPANLRKLLGGKPENFGAHSPGKPQ
jgi:hypothetical protein